MSSSVMKLIHNTHILNIHNSQHTSVLRLNTIPYYIPNVRKALNLNHIAHKQISRKRMSSSEVQPNSNSSLGMASPSPLLLLSFSICPTQFALIIRHFMTCNTISLNQHCRWNLWKRINFQKKYQNVL